MTGSIPDYEELGRIAALLSVRGWITQPQAAKLLHLSTAALKDQVRKGKIEAHQVGARLVITEEEYRRYREFGPRTTDHGQRKGKGAYT